MFKRVICAVICCTLLLTGCSKAITTLDSHVVSDEDKIIHEIYGIEIKQDEGDSKVYWELGGEVYEYKVSSGDDSESIEAKVLESVSDRIVHMILYICVYYVLVFLDA